MPRFDGTGPQGKGPKTGRGMGLCAENEIKSTPFGRGRGLRRGFSRGLRANIPQEKTGENS